MGQSPIDQPANVIAEQGEVILDGPGGLTASFTPDAAKETAGRLMSGAEQARAQAAAKRGD